MKIPDWVQEVLTSFDQKKEAHSELQIVDELDRVRKGHGDLSDPLRVPRNNCHPPRFRDILSRNSAVKRSRQ